MSYLPSTSCGEVGKILHHILNEVIPYKTDGTFVEVGANDGMTGSFTFNLGAIGWTGLNFEPVPRLFMMCCANHKNHKNVKTLPFAIGESEDIVEIIDAGTLSTIDVNTYNVYKNIKGFSGQCVNNPRHQVHVKTLDSILDKNSISDIDVLIVDVEGYEEKVLAGFDVGRFSPTIIIIEIGDQHTDFINLPDIMERFARLRKYFVDNGYTLLLNDVVDNVYVRNSRFNELSEEFVNRMRSPITFPQFVSKPA